MKRRFPLALALFAVVCAGIGILFYSQFTHTDTEQQFKLVMADMQSLQADLKTALPDNPWTLRPSCSQAHEVYTAGSIDCTIDLTYQLAVPASDVMRSTTDKFIKVLLQHSGAFTKMSNKVSSDTLSFQRTLQPGSAGDTFRHVRTNMQCSSYIAITHDKPYVFTLMFTCSSTAQRFYYPRSDIG